MKSQVIIEGKQLKKKGLAMPSDMMQNPEKYKNRVCVAYDVEGKANPYMYVLVGSYTKQNEHDIRYLYTKTTGVKYFNTRVILWETYIERIADAKAQIKRLQTAPYIKTVD